MSVGGIWFHPDPWIQPTLTLAKYSVCMYIKKEIQGVVIYALVTWIYLHLGIACWPKPRKWPKKYRNIEIIARCKLRARHGLKLQIQFTHLAWHQKKEYRRHDGKQPAALCATNNDSTVVPVTIIPNKKQHSLEDCHTKEWGMNSCIL